ncbi:DNA primase [Aquirhabdus parva]|uniref:DNA primase n=1 Tax=Aquirhabdus parva TaxID=2283318 RepID=A0A345P4K2_9GAMM|nr:DNA primase [Aquirhabdus parva]AXI02211.1 toprim domain-containing protein [Aquirhabdus parva]
MSIPRAIVDQIIDRTDLVELIHSHVPLKKSGKSYTACCPFHQESTPSFHVHRDKGYYHCFGCNANGNAISFLMNYENRDFIDVLKDLAQRAGVELPERNPQAVREAKARLSYTRQATPVTQKKTTDIKSSTQPTAVNSSSEAPAADFSGLDEDSYLNSAPGGDDSLDYYEYDFPLQPLAPDEPLEATLYDLVEQVAQFYEQQLTLNPPARAYFDRRGLDDAAIQSWRLGYAPDHANHLAQRFPHDIEGLKKLGLIRTTEQGRDYVLLRDRVIFPIRDPKGRVVGFGGRAMRDDIKPKYINSPESEIFYKNQILYGLYESRKARAEEWLIVEGYMDVIALHQAGLPGAVAALGTATNVDHLLTLFKQNPRVTLAFDGDNAGQRAAWRTLELSLPVLEDGRELRFLVLPQDHDPDSLVRIEGATGLKRRIQNAPPLSDFLYETLAVQHNLAHPEGKSRLMRDAQEMINLLPQNGSYRRLLFQSLRERLGLGWKGKTAQLVQHSLNFEQHSLEEQALLLLLHYPMQAEALEELHELADINQPLGRALQLIAQFRTDLPDDAEQALYFLLGAWPDDRERSWLCHLLDRVNIQSLNAEPVHLEGLCQELALQLCEQYLNRRLRMTSSLSDAKKINDRLMEVRHKLHFRERPLEMGG